MCAAAAPNAHQTAACMPTGNWRLRLRLRSRRACSRWQHRGFTYLMLLFALALGGVGLAALGEQARHRALREQEAELAFRGAEIARAMASYVEASPAGSRTLPRTVDDLLEDRRSGRIVRHLRQLRDDPLGAGWVWLAPNEGGCSRSRTPGARGSGLAGVRSASQRPLIKRQGDEPLAACDLVFRHETFRPQPAPAASAPRFRPSPNCTCRCGTFNAGSRGRPSLASFAYTLSHKNAKCSLPGRKALSPFMTRLPSDPAQTTLVLTDSQVEAIVSSAEAGLDVRRRYQFFVWTQGSLQVLLPHQLDRKSVVEGKSVG